MLKIYLLMMFIGVLLISSEMLILMHAGPALAIAGLWLGCRHVRWQHMKLVIHKEMQNPDEQKS